MNQSGGTWWRSPGWPVPAWVHGNAQYLTHAGFKVSEMLGPNVPPIEMRAPGPRAGLGLMVQPVSANGGPGSLPMPAQDYYSAPVYTSGGGGPVMTPLSPTPAPSPAAPAPPPAQTQATVNPVWLDTNNNVITSAVCGAVYSVTFPGYEGKTLYLIQTKNGAQQFAGNFPIPIANYASKCNQDEGAYQLSGYDPTTGNLIGQGSFTVLPAGTASASASSTGTTGATTPAAAPGVVPTAPAPTQAVGMTPAVPPTTTPTSTSMFANISGVDWILIAAVVIALLNKR